MSSPQLHCTQLRFAYPGSPRTLFEHLDLHLAQGWTGIIGANGSGKTTLLQLITDELSLLSGHIHGPSLAIYCEQRTDTMPARFTQFLEAYDNYLYLEPLGIGYDWDQRWSTLSHGERKRAQLAVALWQRPDLLAIDEPTNHLDGEARAQVLEALQQFRGIGLLVSHDRQLLDELCSHSFYLSEGRGDLRQGNYSESQKELAREREEQSRNYHKARTERKRLEREVKKARQEASQARGSLSKKGISRKDHDAKSKIDGARLSGKDTVSARLMNRLQTRMDWAADSEQANIQKQTDLGIRFNTGASRKNRFYQTPSHTLTMGENRLSLPPLYIESGDRIGLVGPNGAGKSTLIRHIRKNLNLTDAECLYLPQEISREQTVLIIERIQALPGGTKGRLLQLVSRLGSDPKRLLDSHLPSPGETRKLLLAEGLVTQPSLMIMDEPTNHLDLPSVECLESALQEIDCALLLVSHDPRFLNALCKVFWRLKPGNQGEFHLEI